MKATLHQKNGHPQVPKKKKKNVRRSICQEIQNLNVLEFIQHVRIRILGPPELLRGRIVTLRTRRDQGLEAHTSS